MEIVELKIRIPNELKAYYEAFSSVEEAERNARLMYSYIIDGSISIEWAAEKLNTNTKDLTDYYNYLELPLNNIKKYIEERDDSHIR